MADMDLTRIPPFNLLDFTDRSGIAVAVHQLTHPADIDIYRTKADTSAASDTLDPAFVFVDIILELVHETLAHALHFQPAGIMPGSMQRKQREHAAVPVAHPLA